MPKDEESLGKVAEKHEGTSGWKVLQHERQRKRMQNFHKSMKIYKRLAGKQQVFIAKDWRWKLWGELLKTNTLGNFKKNFEILNKT